MRNVLVAASVLALIAGSASAATVTYTSSTPAPNTVSPINAQSLAFNVLALTLPQFDATIGMLTTVTLNWTGSLSGTATVTKGNSAGLIFSASTSAFLSGTGPSSLAMSLSPTDDLITSPEFFAANQFKSYDVDATDTLTEIFTSADGEFAAFLGTGDVSYLFDGFDFSGSSQQGGAAVSPSTFGSVDVVVTYTYDTTVIPVPAALPLLASAFGVLGLMRLRRKA
jgi:hypothetical protein